MQCHSVTLSHCIVTLRDCLVLCGILWSAVHCVVNSFLCSVLCGWCISWKGAIGSISQVVAASYNFCGKREIIRERKGEISNKNAPFVKWQFFGWILKNIKNWHNRCGRWWNDNDLDTVENVDNVYDVGTFGTIWSNIRQSDKILKTLLNYLITNMFLIDASASTKWWLEGYNRDKNMLGYDQLRYIGCQRRMAPQIFTRENQSGSFSAQDDTLSFWSKFRGCSDHWLPTWSIFSHIIHSPQVL